MKTAIVYDRVNKFGGAERVLLALHEIFPDAPLYTSVYSPEKAPWARVFPKVYTSFLNKIKFIRDKHQFLAPLMPIAFEMFNFNDYDIVLSVTSEAAKGVITKPGTLHICYCLTPTRYLWSGYDEYFPKDTLKGATLQGIAKPVISYLRNWDRIAAQRPDKIIAISTEVQSRIKKYYGRESELIYPPVYTKKFEIRNPKFETNYKFQITNSKPTTNHQSPVTNYYLIVSRLEAYKKVDIAIEAFVKMGKTLVVVGTGTKYKEYVKKYRKYVILVSEQRERIQNQILDFARMTEKNARMTEKSVRMTKNIIFRGFVDDDEVIKLMQNAKGFIYPQEEDLGITAVEAQAAGCPVIAYKKGGAVDTVIDPSVNSGRVATGVFFDKQNVESLVAAVSRFEKMKFDKGALQKNAERFDKERFKLEFMRLVNTKKGSS